MRKPIVVTVAAGAALTVALAGCGAKETVPDEISHNPPAPDPVPTANPPPPETAPKPAWDDVKSGHPEGATNPPIPVLVVTPAGDCYKGWRSPMVPPTPENQDRVQECATPDGCGTAVQCPPQAEELLAAWKAGQEPGPR